MIHSLSVVLLANAVTVGVPLLAFGIHITNPQIVKGWLNDTNTYETIITESLDLIALESQVDNSGETTGSLGETFDQNPYINSDAITQIMEETFTPDFVQAQFVGVIDGLYEWLDGTTDKPEFEFSLNDKKPELTERLRAEMLSQFEGLPPCTPEEYAVDFNLIDALCRPEGISIEAEVDRFVAEFTGEEGIFSDVSFSGDDLVESEGKESGLSERQLQLGQQAYSGLQNGPLFLLAAGVIAAFVLFISSRSRFRGFSEVGNIMFSGSLFIFFTALVISFNQNFITRFIGENDSSDATVRAARALFEPLLQRIIGDVASLTVVVSGATLVLGTFMVGWSFYLRNKYRREESERMEKEWHDAAEEARIKEIKKLAKKHPKKYAHLTKDPKTNKPLKESKDKITVHHARKIVRDPDTKRKKVSELPGEDKK